MIIINILILITTVPHFVPYKICLRRSFFFLLKIKQPQPLLKEIIQGSVICSSLLFRVNWSIELAVAVLVVVRRRRRREFNKREGRESFLHPYYTE